MSKQYDELITVLTRGYVTKIQTHITTIQWSLLPEEGQMAVLLVTRKLVQYTLDEARGVDRTLARKALVATILNWKTVAWIHADGLVDDFWDVLTAGLVEAGVVALRILSKGVL